jgi:hypothetical protein
MDEVRLSRLLHLYPVEAIRDEWEITGKTKDVIIADVVEQFDEDAILTFARVSHGLTKQRVIIFDNTSGSVADFADPLLAEREPFFVERKAQRIEEFYFLPVSYQALVGPPFVETSLDFIWPIRIVLDTKHAILTFTIIEKNINTYLPSGQRAYSPRKEFDEEGVCVILLQQLPAGTVQRADLNKGVKAMWDAGQIDALHTRWKAAMSTKTETMDVRRLLKRDDPEAYKQAVKAPLLKTVFQTLAADEGFPPLLTVDPSQGEIIVTRYSKKTDEVENVVRAIL